MSVVTEYCKVCGHGKEHHDLNVHRQPGHHKIDSQQRACDQMSFGNHACICVEYESWTTGEQVGGVG
jgi:hypothetical protein